MVFPRVFPCVEAMGREVVGRVEVVVVVGREMDASREVLRMVEDGVPNPTVVDVAAAAVSLWG